MFCRPYRILAATTLALLIKTADAPACTVISAPQFKDHLVGKSYDWDFEDGLLIVNKRRVEKKALVLDTTSTPAQWTSRYGSVTFNQYGREFPLGGINESGLVVEIAWLDGTQYPRADSRPSLNELQWVQYQLDQFATVKEVLAHVTDTRIAQAHAPVHYLVCDAARECLTVEFLRGKVVTHSGSKLDVPVLSNDPYAIHRKALGKYQGFGGRRSLPAGGDSFARYARAAAFARSSQGSTETESQAQLFTLLQAVNQGDFSKWHITYSTANGLISWRSASRQRIKTARLADFDFACSSPVKIHPVVSDTEGDTSAQFEDYTADANRKLLNTTLKPIADKLPPGTLDLVADYPETLSCLD
jgi:choloylglycine hydrolase